MQTIDRDAPDRDAPLLLALGLAFCASMPAGFPRADALPTVTAANSALYATVQVNNDGARGVLATAGQHAGDVK
jgi:hypothetical protein